MAIHAQTEKDGSAVISIDGRSQKIKGKSLDDARAKVRDVAINHAARLAKPIVFTSADPSGEFRMLVHPDGKMENATAEDIKNSQTVEAAVESKATDVEKVSPEPDHESAKPIKPVSTEPATAVEAEEAMNASKEATKEAAKNADTYPSRRSLRDTSFLTNDDPIAPATKGPRSWLKFIGIRPQPSAAELSEREDIQAVSQHWPGIRTIAVTNRKGGSNKTPTVACLAAVYARYGGGGVLAWDNNENQGTLGWRTAQGTHGASVLDVLRDQELLMSPTATQGLMAGYVHHQTEDKYDVLRSDENDEGDHEIQANEVHEAHTVASRYFRMIVMDSGNTARAANWLAMIEHTDQLVIPTTTMEDRAEAARLTLQTLAARDEHGAKLAEEAVVIISQWKAEDRAEAQRIASLFEPLVRAVVIVPYDPALKAGRIRYEALRPATQRAWLAAAAAVARGL